MKKASHRPGSEIQSVLLFLGSIWIVYFISLPFPAVERYGLVPRTA